jgi:hypothetical protein
MKATGDYVNLVKIRFSFYQLDTIGPSITPGFETFLCRINPGDILPPKAISVFIAIIHEQFIRLVQLLHDLIAFFTSDAMLIRVMVMGQPPVGRLYFPQRRRLTKSEQPPCLFYLAEIH